MKFIFLHLTLMLAGIAVGAWLWQGPFLSQWLALLVWAGVAVFGVKNGLQFPETVRRRIPEVAAPTLLLGISAAIYHPFALGRMPWMADHLVHQARARLFFDHFLSHGRLSGWTHLPEAGVPFETLYPPGADFTLSLVHLLGFGKLSWETTYALTFFAFLLLYVFTFYWLGRRFGGPLAGLLAGLFALTDAGAFRQGGFSFMVQWGVWPLSFSLALALWAVYMADRHHETGRGFWRSAALGAVALCVHPFALFVVFPLHFLVVLCRQNTPEPLPSFGRFLALSLATFLLSAWWLVPFLSYGPGFSAPVPALAGSLHQAASGLVEAAPWGNADTWIAVLGIAGIIRLLAIRGPAFPTALSAYALLALVLGSTSVLAGLDLFSWLPALSHVQFPRFLIVVKAAAFLGAALFAVSLLRRPSTPDEAGKPQRLRLLWMAAALLLAFPLGQKIVENYFLPLTDYTTNPPWKKNVLDAARHLSKIAASRAGFFRVALDGPFNDHRLMPIVTHTGLPYVKLSYMPAETFIHAAHENPSDVPRSREELVRLNVAYVASVGPSQISDLRLLTRFGDIHLYEFAAASPLRHEIDPPARVSIERFDDEGMAFDVSGLPPEGGWLRLYVAPFPRWKATIDGQEVPIGEYRPTPRQTFLQIPVHNGRVEFRYERGAPDVAGFWLTLSGLALLAFFRMPASWRERIQEHPLVLRLRLRMLKQKSKMLEWKLKFFSRKSKATEKNLKTLDAEVEKFQGNQKYEIPVRDRLVRILKNRHLQAAFALLLLAAAGWGLRETAPDGSFALHRARVRVDEGLDTRTCPYVFPERFLCGRAHRFVGLELREVGKKVRRGIWAHPIENARLQIEFPGVWMAGPLHVEAGIADSGSGPDIPVTLRVYFDDRLIATLVCSDPGVWKNDIVTAPEYTGRRVTVRFEVTSPNVGGRHFLFHPHF